MISAQHIVSLATVYSAATAVPIGTISHRVFDDGKKIQAMEAGADITLRRYNMALRWFAENWPVDAIWPSEVARPSDSEKELA